MVQMVSGGIGSDLAIVEYLNARGCKRINIGEDRL
jgi:hypothetical protein